MAENRDFQSGPAAAPQTTVSGARVPPILHQFWFGRERDDAEAMMGWARRTAKASGWRYIRWTVQDAIDQLPAVRAFIPKCRTVSQMSNVVRFGAVEAMGGLYLDADVMLRRLPEGLTGAWILLERSGLANPAALAAPPQHPFVRRLADALSIGEFYDSDRQGMLAAAFATKKIGDFRCWNSTHWASHETGSRSTDGEYGTHLFRRDDWRSARPKGEP